MTLLHQRPGALISQLARSSYDLEDDLRPGAVERLCWRFYTASSSSPWLDISAQTRLADDQKSKV